MLATARLRVRRPYSTSFLEPWCQPTETLREKDVNRPGHVHVLLHAWQARHVSSSKPPVQASQLTGLDRNTKPSTAHPHTHTHKRLHHLTGRHGTRTIEGFRVFERTRTPGKTKRIFTCCSAEGTQQHHPPPPPPPSTPSSSANHEIPANIAETSRLLRLNGGIWYRLIRRTHTESRYTTAKRPHYPTQSCPTITHSRPCRPSYPPPTSPHLGDATHSFSLKRYVGLQLQQARPST